MSLLEAAFTECVILDKHTEADGEGGVITTYSEGAKFGAAVTFDSSMQARIANKQGVSSMYTATTNKSVVLQFHDVFKRLEDGKVFRVTSDGDDKATPASSTLNMRQVTAEEFKL